MSKLNIKNVSKFVNGIEITLDFRTELLDKLN